jgi:hypothetical protein
MEQRCFARSRFTYQSDEFSLANFQIQIVEDHNLLVAGTENLRKLLGSQEWACIRLSHRVITPSGHWVIGSLAFPGMSACSCGPVRGRKNRQQLVGFCQQALHGPMGPMNQSLHS